MQKHIVIIKQYEGFTEYLSDEPDERKSAEGLGLPVEEIAEGLGCRITILHWDDWFPYDAQEAWVPTPATRPASQPEFGNHALIFRSGRVKRVPVPAKDPEYGLPISEKGLSPRSHGLINDSGLLFFLSCCLSMELRTLYNEDPFQAIVVPMWGGIGYVSQMARATEAYNLAHVPFVVVVTDISAHRQIANQEGFWTRHSIIRRQMEDVSLALADLVLVFGPRGNEIALSGRLPEAQPPICVPRFVEGSLIDKIVSASEQSAPVDKPLQFFLYEPQQAASGVLSALDAVNLLANKGVRLQNPVISGGPPMIFAPMKPRCFESYWSSRGWVAQLLREQQWEWRREYPFLDDVFPIRLYPSFFEHVPNIWSELARGSLVLLSAAAAEGLAPGKILPPEVLLQGEPLAEKLAACMERIIKTDIHTLDRTRRDLCACVIAGHRGEKRRQLLRETTEALGQLLRVTPKPQDLSRVALLFLDRRLGLCTLAQNDTPPALPGPRPGTEKGTLSVVVTCYEMGALIKEAVENVWKSERQPDEVLLIDDGSQGEETLTSIWELERFASEKNLPLRVIRQRNRGLAWARNCGLEAAHGEYISFLDGDDVIEPAFYRIALQILGKYSRLGGVAAWASIFGTDVQDGFWNAPQTELPFIFAENSVIVPCLVRAELLRNLGGYDVRQRYNYEDWELAIRMLASGWPIVTIPMHLLKYRIRGDSLYRSMTNVQNQVMRELLFTTHRDTVSKFAVEIAMQLEDQWMKLRYRDPNPAIPLSELKSSAPVPGSLSKAARKILDRFKRWRT